MSDKNEKLIEIDWYGNVGYCHPNPGTEKSVKCGVCGTMMKVIKRNVLGPTSLAESVMGSKHLHDVFECPYLREEWHRIIHQLKMDAYFAEIGNRGDKNIIKKKAERKIRKLLANHPKTNSR